MKLKNKNLKYLNNIKENKGNSIQNKNYNNILDFNYNNDNNVYNKYRNLIIDNNNNKKLNKDDYEKYINQLYIFPEFHHNNKNNSELYRINIPHYSFYDYSDDNYSINEFSKNNLLSEATMLKKMNKLLKNELNRQKQENEIQKKYMKLLEDTIYINNNQPKIKDKTIIFNKSFDESIKNISHKVNFNYKDYKNNYNNISDHYPNYYKNINNYYLTENVNTNNIISYKDYYQQISIYNEINKKINNHNQKQEKKLNILIEENDKFDKRKRLFGNQLNVKKEIKYDKKDNLTLIDRDRKLENKLKSILLNNPNSAYTDNNKLSLNLLDYKYKNKEGNQTINLNDMNTKSKQIIERLLDNNFKSNNKNQIKTNIKGNDHYKINNLKYNINYGINIKEKLNDINKIKEDITDNNNINNYKNMKSAFFSERLLKTYQNNLALNEKCINSRGNFKLSNKSKDLVIKSKEKDEISNISNQNYNKINGVEHYYQKNNNSSNKIYHKKLIKNEKTNINNFIYEKGKNNSECNNKKFKLIKYNNKYPKKKYNQKSFSYDKRNISSNQTISND